MDTLTAPAPRPRMAEAIQQQGRSECVLATLATLGGKAIDDVRRVAMTEAQRHQPNAKTWADTLNLRDRGKYAYLRGVRVAAVFCGVSPELVSFSAVDGQGVRVLSRYLRTLPSTGRGVVRIGRSRTRRGHIMPFEDGLCYDPANPDKGRTLREIRALYRGYMVNYIHQEA